MTAVPRPRAATKRAGPPVPVALGLVVVGGMCAAAQAGVNGQLGQAMSSPLLAATVSNTLGGVVFVVALLFVPRVRQGARQIWRHRLPWWMYTGGLFGAAFVFAGAFTVPLLGVALFTVAQVCGNSLGALGSDAAGLGPAGRLRITAFRFAGAVVAIVAVAVSQTGRDFSFAGWWLVPFIVLIGVGLALQGAFNGQVNEVSGTPLATGLVNFVVGTGILYAVVGIAAVVSRFDAFVWPSSPWMYLGGPLGSVLLICSMLAIRVVGVLRMALGVLTGQLLGALGLDLLAGKAPSAWVMAGMVLTVVAVLLAGRGSRAPVAESAVAGEAGVASSPADKADDPVD